MCLRLAFGKSKPNAKRKQNTTLVPERLWTSRGKRVKINQEIKRKKRCFFRDSYFGGLFDDCTAGGCPEWLPRLIAFPPPTFGPEARCLPSTHSDSGRLHP